MISTGNMELDFKTLWLKAVNYKQRISKNLAFGHLIPAYRPSRLNPSLPIAIGREGQKEFLEMPNIFFNQNNHHQRSVFSFTIAINDF